MGCGFVFSCFSTVVTLYIGHEIIWPNVYMKEQVVYRSSTNDIIWPKKREVKSGIDFCQLPVILPFVIGAAKRMSLHIQIDAARFCFRVCVWRKDSKLPNEIQWKINHIKKHPSVVCWVIRVYYFLKNPLFMWVKLLILCEWNSLYWCWNALTHSVTHSLSHTHTHAYRDRK